MNAQAGMDSDQIDQTVGVGTSCYFDGMNGPTEDDTQLTLTFFGNRGEEVKDSQSFSVANTDAVDVEIQNYVDFADPFLSSAVGISRTTQSDFSTQSITLSSANVDGTNINLNIVANIDSANVPNGENTHTATGDLTCRPY
jgi:hypothetical protein